MSRLGSGSRAVQRLGVVVPVHADTSYATALAVELSQQHSPSVSVDLMFVDNGDNEDLATKLPKGVTCLVEAARGPGHARTAGVQWLVGKWSELNVPLDQCWVISLDADASVGHDFFVNWETAIRVTSACVLTGEVDVEPLHGETAPPPGAGLAAGWLWDMALRCESLVGPVNVSGCNHAVRADVCMALGAYIQPTAMDSAGHESLVAGDDWDFGLRARMQGYDVLRLGSTYCRTSSRRLTKDPVGYLTGRSYEGAFRPVDGSSAGSWPPSESWTDIATEATSRLAAHFLIKPVLCGIPLKPESNWFLGSDLCAELADLAGVQTAREAASAPGRDVGLDVRLSVQWIRFRRQLIHRLFEPDLKDLSLRLAARLQGIKHS